MKKFVTLFDVILKDNHIINGGDKGIEKQESFLHFTQSTEIWTPGDC